MFSASLLNVSFMYVAWKADNARYEASSFQNMDGGPCDGS